MNAFGKSTSLASAIVLPFAFIAAARSRSDTRTIHRRARFACGGKLINSWAMLYPTTARERIDKVVDAIAQTYSLGADRTGNCDA